MWLNFKLYNSNLLCLLWFKVQVERKIRKQHK